MTQKLLDDKVNVYLIRFIFTGMVALILSPSLYNLLIENADHFSVIRLTIVIGLLVGVIIQVIFNHFQFKIKMVFYP